MSELLDELARAMSNPMPRSRAVRVLGVALASAAVPLLRPRTAAALSSSELSTSCHGAQGVCDRESLRSGKIGRASCRERVSDTV